MLFEWDENKRNSNLKKHGIGFQDATGIFEDERYFDVEIEYANVMRGENRRIIFCKEGKSS